MKVFSQVERVQLVEAARKRRKKAAPKPAEVKPAAKKFLDSYAKAHRSEVLHAIKDAAHDEYETEYTPEAVASNAAETIFQRDQYQMKLMKAFKEYVAKHHLHWLDPDDMKMPLARHVPSLLTFEIIGEEVEKDEDGFIYDLESEHSDELWKVFRQYGDRVDVDFHAQDARDLGGTHLGYGDIYVIEYKVRMNNFLTSANLADAIMRVFGTKLAKHHKGGKFHWSKGAEIERIHSKM